MATNSNSKDKYIHKNKYKYAFENNDTYSSKEFMKITFSMLDIYNNGFKMQFPDELRGLSIEIINDLFSIDDLKVWDIVNGGVQIPKDCIKIPDKDVDINKLAKDICRMVLLHLPKNIVYLKTENVDIEQNTFVDINLSNLETLIINGINYEYKCDYSFVDNLPNSLIRLEFNCCAIEHTLDNLPPNLKELTIDTGGIGDYCDGYMHPLDNLPSGLEVLYFPDTIDMDSNDMPANLNNLPASLKYLHLHCFLSSKTDFNNLPQSLEELVISQGDCNKFTVYPPNLKRLYLFGGCVDSYKEKMKTMKSNGEINFDIYELNYPDYEPELLELF